jgi:uncharacterized membrane protein
MIGLAVILFILCLAFFIILVYRDFERITKKEEDASSQKTKRRKTGEW